MARVAADRSNVGHSRRRKHAKNLRRNDEKIKKVNQITSYTTKDKIIKQ